MTNNYLIWSDSKYERKDMWWDIGEIISTHIRCNFSSNAFSGRGADGFQRVQRMWAQLGGEQLGRSARISFTNLVQKGLFWVDSESVVIFWLSKSVVMLSCNYFDRNACVRVFWISSFLAIHPNMIGQTDGITGSCIVKKTVRWHYCWGNCVVTSTHGQMWFYSSRFVVCPFLKTRANPTSWVERGRGSHGSSVLDRAVLSFAI
jgi:hypothetical protein